jgi:hypothetical protein
LHEFLIHIHRRNNKFKEYSEVSESAVDASELSNTAMKENLIVVRYFENTLKNSVFVWPESKISDLKKTASSWNGHYTSGVGRLITSFSLKTAWLLIISALTVVWIVGNKWERKLQK